MINERKVILSLWLFVFSCCIPVLLLPAVAQSQQGTVTVTVGDGVGPQGSTANPVLITLDNPDDRKKVFNLISAGAPTLRSLAAQVLIALKGLTAASTIKETIVTG